MFLTSKTIGEEGKTTETVQILTKMIIDCNERNCFQKLRLLRSFMIERERRIALYPSGGCLKGPVFRKMAERKGLRAQCIIGPLRRRPRCQGKGTLTL